MKSTIERIRKYTQENSELLAAHHFLFDLRLNPAGVDYCVMGINPGETDDEKSGCPGPTEETSLFDFHAQYGRGPSSTRWLANINFFLNTDRVVLGEYFFWSSANAEAEFAERFGPLRLSPHLKFCRDMNLELIENYKPKAVISPGLGMARIASNLYGLELVASEKSANGNNLIFHYSDGKRPWIFTKHWTGARGFSKPQRDQVQSYISKHAS